MLFAVTSYTWIVTGLGFGIVLGLLFCLVFILQFFGFIMQKVEKTSKYGVPSIPSQPTQPSPAQEEKSDEEEAAVAMALYLASLEVKHDAPTSMISLKQRETVWNTKSIGLN